MDESKRSHIIDQESFVGLFGSDIILRFDQQPQINYETEILIH